MRPPVFDMLIRTFQLYVFIGIYMVMSLHNVIASANTYCDVLLGARRERFYVYVIFCISAAE